MQTFKEVLKRKEERQNLKHIGFCMLTVLMLVVGAFSVVVVDALFKTRPMESGWWASTERVQDEDGFSP